ncbi:hypothetical protein TorRG33x02_082030 [Trema orientale]|uniref:Protein BIG GRAIN 1-like B n=1 Tax=Trema orientale TaxID=63057 RepID=A0A2P5FDT7_TREOI|nr:hypothetical protein TorRG33x02_082030 [Trema orientale]
MYGVEKKTLREGRYKHEKESPSFSSSLLDKIYRSIDEGHEKSSDDLRFFKETKMAKKQSKTGKIYRAVEKEEEEGEEMASFRRACLIEKWMEKKASEKVATQRRRPYNNYSDFDQDVLFFSSTSSSSDSSSGGFSSSDTESMYGARSAVSFPSSARPKPVRTGVTPRQEKTERKQHSALFYEQSEYVMFGDYHCSFDQKEKTPKIQDEGLIKSKSRALKIYNNLKKVKQPISPGGRLASFINSLFTSGTTRKAKNDDGTLGSERINNKSSSKPVHETTTTCSSASSYSRSCLSKSSPSTREKLRNGVKRSVRFYPVSVIVDEDCRPCGHKCVYGEEDSGLVPVSVPTAWKIGPSPARKAEEVAKEFLRDYRQNQMKNDIVKRGNDVILGNEDVDDDDDAASYSSSDLFELDHLAVIGKDRYREELPVYETTRVDKNRAIANGLIM